MKLALKIVLWLEIVAGILWTLLAVTAGNTGGLAVFAAFFYVYVLFAACFLFALWVYWKHPDRRRIAGWIMGLPMVFWFLPMVIGWMAGGDLSTKQLFGVLVVVGIAAIGFCWLSPRKATAVVPNFLLRSRVFNWLIILAMVAAWSLFVFVLLYVLNSKGSSSTGTGEGLGLAIVIAAIYVVWLGFGSFVASTWAWLSLRGGIEPVSRKLHYAQMVLAAPGVLAGIVVAFWMTAQAGT